MEAFKTQVAEVAGKALEIPAEEARLLIEFPRDARHGDFAIPCFTLAKKLKKSPVELAKGAAAAIECVPPLTAVTATGPYLNFSFDPQVLAETVLGAVLAQGDAYGSTDEGAGKTIVIDFSSPNIAKPFGIHHLRSTVIGAAIGRICRARGYTVEGVNHLGDWGTQFGQLIVAYRNWGDEARLDAEGIPFLLELYVRFNEEAKQAPQMQDQARAAFSQLEQGDRETRALWKRFREVSETEFRRIYERLGIRFEHYTGESFYESRMPAVVEELTERGMLEQSDDATIIDLSDDDLGVCIIKKANDSSLYMTRDLAAAIYRNQEFSFHKALYVVGAAQGLHFRQLFRVLELMEKPFAAAMVHVPFGLLRFKDEKMSTREGKVIYLEEVLDRSVELARKIAEENPNLKAADSVAEAVGIGAVIFNDLKAKRIKDVTFDWDEILSFEGDTGPYLQYSCARISSIFRKAGRDPATQKLVPGLGLLESDVERDLIRSVSRYPDAVRRAAVEFEPSIVSQQLLQTAACLNRFYNECRVLGVAEELTEARLALVRAAQITLRNGLDLLGLSAPEEM